MQLQIGKRHGRLQGFVVVCRELVEFSGQSFMNQQVKRMTRTIGHKKSYYNYNKTKFCEKGKDNIGRSNSISSWKCDNVKVRHVNMSGKSGQKRPEKVVNYWCGLQGLIRMPFFFFWPYFSSALRQDKYSVSFTFL